MGYSEEHKVWVRNLAGELCKDGVDVILDYWDLKSGESLTKFMEDSICKSDYVLIICTPKYKKRADDRAGGVGYEDNIITALSLYTDEIGKFIPVLRNGTWKGSAPVWLLDKVYIDLSGTPYSEENYIHLLAAIHNIRIPRPPVKKGVPIEKISKYYGLADDIKRAEGSVNSITHTQELAGTEPLSRKKVNPVDEIMNSLKDAETIGECKLLDHKLSQIYNEDSRIQHYLFYGNQRQRNYAALYFKRKGNMNLLKQAYDQGKIDRTQAFGR